MNCFHSQQIKDPGFTNRKLECYREIQNPHSIIISSLINATGKLAKNHVRVTSSNITIEKEDLLIKHVATENMRRMEYRKSLQLITCEFNSWDT
jgi:hypothetical protein